MSIKTSDKSNTAVAVETEHSDNFSIENYRWSAMAAAGIDSEDDVLQELKKNIQRLETVHARMQFMMNEISSVVKRS